MYKKIFTTIIMLIATGKITFGQTIDKNFLGFWGDTFWEFHFHKNGHYERISEGHFGNTKARGKYKIVNDTIKIISGYEKSYGTINSQYIIDDDDILIDLDLGYGYQRVLNSESSKYKDLHELLYPEIVAVNEKVVADLEEVLNLALNSDRIKKFYHFESLAAREFIIANYFKLKATIVVEGRRATFKDKKDIKEKFYIEFENIDRFYDQISFTINIHDEGVHVTCYYKKYNGKWKKEFIEVKEY